MTQDIDGKMLDAQVAISTSGIKQVIIINGAADIALLAFLGQISGKEIAESTSLLLPDIATITSALLTYGYGVAAGTVSFLFAYVFQTAEREWSWPRWISNIFRGLAVISVVAGWVLFLYGIHLTADAFSPSHRVAYLNSAKCPQATQPTTP